MENSKKPDLISPITIEKLSKKGFGVGFFQNDKVEIPHCFPEDVVEAVLRKKRKGLRKARMQKIITPSPFRVEAKCSHSFLCGGCLWQMLSYEKQLQIKQESIQEIFQNVLTKEVILYPILPAPTLWQYRNKMEFSFSQNKANTKFLGLMIARAQRFVFNLTDCALCSVWFSKVLESVRQWWQQSSLIAYDPMENSGTLRFLTLREGKNTAQKMIILTVCEKENNILSLEDKETFVQTIKNTLSDDLANISIYLRVQKIAKNHPTTMENFLLFGLESIEEIIDLKEKKLSFLISPSSFFQPNTLQAQVMYQEAIDILEPKKTDVLYDLYCGTGSFGKALSFFAKKVIGVESCWEAAQDAKKNSQRNQIDNLEIFCGDVGKTLVELLAKGYPKADAVLVDPPRAGLDDLAIENILLLEPKKILYVSCNPYTQEENINKFIEKGYKLLCLQPIDQFPHTPHVENIAYLVR